MSSLSIVYPKNDQELFEYLESSYSSEDRFRKIDPSEVYGAVKSVKSVFEGTRPIAWIGSAQFPKEMKEFLQRFVEVTVLERREYDPDAELKALYWDKSLVPVSVSEKWVIGRKGTRDLQQTFQGIKRTDPYFHQKVGEALFYEDSKVNEWCLKNGYPYRGHSKL